MEEDKLRLKTHFKEALFLIQSTCIWRGGRVADSRGLDWLPPPYPKAEAVC